MPIVSAFRTRSFKCCKCLQSLFAYFTEVSFSYWLWKMTLNKVNKHMSHFRKFLSELLIVGMVGGGDCEMEFLEKVKIRSALWIRLRQLYIYYILLYIYIIYSPSCRILLLSACAVFHYLVIVILTYSSIFPLQIIMFFFKIS